MRLYSMHKREFVMVFLAFFGCFGLGLFIGFAGTSLSSTRQFHDRYKMLHLDFFVLFESADGKCVTCS